MRVPGLRPSTCCHYSSAFPGHCLLGLPAYSLAPRRQERRLNHLLSRNSSSPTSFLREWDLHVPGQGLVFTNSVWNIRTSSKNAARRYRPRHIPTNASDAEGPFSLTLHFPSIRGVAYARQCSSTTILQAQQTSSTQPSSPQGQTLNPNPFFSSHLTTTTGSGSQEAWPACPSVGASRWRYRAYDSLRREDPRRASR